jgi:ketosteroid isomerase-like protein
MDSPKPTGRDPTELTRRAYAAVNSRDYDAILSFFGEDSVWDVSRMGLGSHTGLTAIRHFLEDWIGSFEEYRLDVEEVFGLSNGVVRLIASINARPAGSNSRVHLKYAPVLLWVDGVAMRVTHYRDPEESRLAAEQLAGERELRAGGRDAA